jgi:hypothetical protein
MSSYGKTISEDDMKMIKQHLKNKKSQIRKIYEPAPKVGQDFENKGYQVDRDSDLISEESISTGDILNIRFCRNSPVQFNLDKNFKDKMQEAIVDNTDDFEAKPFLNKTSVYVKFKERPGKNQVFETTLRMIMESDDSTYVIKLFGEACPSRGASDYPVVYKLKKTSSKSLTFDDNNLMTPEDKILTLSKGLPRKNGYNLIQFRDMQTSSNSDVFVFSLEIQYRDYPDYVNVKGKSVLNKPQEPIVYVLDNLQMNLKKNKLSYLSGATEAILKYKEKREEIKSNGMKNLERYSFYVNISKKWMRKSRYIYVMLIFPETKHYEYVMIDLYEYFKSLKERELKI